METGKILLQTPACTMIVNDFEGAMDQAGEILVSGNEVTLRPCPASIVKTLLTLGGSDKPAAAARQAATARRSAAASTSRRRGLDGEVLRALKTHGSVTVPELIAHLGFKRSESGTKTVLQRLEQQGKVVKSNERPARWSLVEKAEAIITCAAREREIPESECNPNPEHPACRACEYGGSDA